jgi:hypothetical protein
MVLSRSRTMARVRFHAPSIDLDLSGSEESIEQRLRQLAPQLGPVDVSVLAAPQQEVPAQKPARPSRAPAAVIEGLDEFLAQHPASAREGQAEAAIRIAYYLQERAGLSSLARADFVRAFLRARVDTRDVNGMLDRLVADGVLVGGAEPGSYRLSPEGVHAAEQRYRG